MNTSYSNPKITVLMSVFNGEKFLKEAIESILHQTYDNFEFMIINDGSIDSSKNIILSYSDQRIRLVNNGKNIGLIASLNNGFALARGEYIARQDADDISALNRLEEQINFFEKNKNIGLVGTNFIKINEIGEEVQRMQLPQKSEDLRKELLMTNQFAHGSVMFKKECLEKTGLYREEFKHCEDYDLWLRFSQHYDLANIQEYLYKWRLVQISISSKQNYFQKKATLFAIQMHKERLLFGQDQIQKGLLNKEDVHKLILSSKDEQDETVYKIKVLRCGALRYLINNDSKNSRKCYWEAFKLKKFRIKTFILIIFSFLKPFCPKSLFRFLLETNETLLSKIEKNNE